MNWIRLLVVMWACLASVTGYAASSVSQPRLLTFGIVPQQAAFKLAATWTPLFRQLEADTGYRIRFETARDIPTFEQRLAAGEYDLAYMNPYHYTIFSQQPGYRAIARERTRLKGIIVTRKDAPINTIEALKGKEMAFPGPASFAATILPLAALQQQDIRVRPSYVSSHESVYLAVAKGLFPAGGGVLRTFLAMPDEVRDQLRVLWTTEGYTPHAIAAHPRLPPDVVARLVTALLRLNDTAEGKDALAGVSFTGLDRAEDREWDEIRDLKIKNLDHLLK